MSATSAGSHCARGEIPCHLCNQIHCEDAVWTRVSRIEPRLSVSVVSCAGVHCSAVSRMRVLAQALYA